MISFLFLMLCFFQSIITNVINIIVICVVTQSYKQVVLTPQSTGNDARVVILSSTEVTSSSSAWTISPIDTKFGWHLKVNLDASWGFDPNYESTITFQIDGDPLPTDRSLFAFTTGRINQNGKYIMARIRRFHWNYMFPQCSATTMIFGDANAVLDSCPDNDPSFEDRVDCLQSRLGMHHLSDEINTIQGNGDKAFPIKFTLTNKPDESLRLTIESTSTNQDYIDVCDYESFDNTNDGLRVYFAVDYSTTTTVNSFTITYSTTAPITTTPNPTKRPTPNPTQRPTPNPTRSPSKRPTPNPTRKPTLNPTRRPTPNPSKRPTPNPTKKPTPNPTTPVPTNQPTKKPTPNPSKRPTPNPTKAPIVATPEPTKRPTPSNIPTNTPSDLSSNSPSNIPSNIPTGPPNKVSTFSPSNIPTVTLSGDTIIAHATPTARPSNNPVNPVYVTIEETEDKDKKDIKTNASASPLLLIISVALGVTILVIISAICCYYKKKITAVKTQAHMIDIAQMDVQSTQGNVANDFEKGVTTGGIVNQITQRGNQIKSKGVATGGYKEEITAQTLLDWLTHVVGLPQYHAVFIEYGFSSFRFVKRIENEEQIRDMGIDNEDHVSLILSEIRHLCNQRRGQEGLRPRGSNEDGDLEGHSAGDGNVMNHNDQITQTGAHGMTDIGSVVTRNVSKCIDCLQVKEGREYEEDGQFYCHLCWSSYVNDVEGVDMVYTNEGPRDIPLRTEAGDETHGQV
eukprot:927957_1